jgi:hypothetical protein
MSTEAQRVRWKRHREKHRDKCNAASCLNYQNNRARYLERIGRIRDERRRLVDSFKSQPCADCGIQYPPCVMDFDHVRGEKLFNVGELARGARKVDMILAEIDKCEVVCANCHRLRESRRRGCRKV